MKVLESSQNSPALPITKPLLSLFILSSSSFSLALLPDSTREAIPQTCSLAEYFNLAELNAAVFRARSVFDDSVMSVARSCFQNKNTRTEGSCFKAVFRNLFFFKKHSHWISISKATSMMNYGQCLHFERPEVCIVEYCVRVCVCLQQCLKQFEFDVSMPPLSCAARWLSVYVCVLKDTVRVCIRA